MQELSFIHISYLIMCINVLIYLFIITRSLRKIVDLLEKGQQKQNQSQVHPV